MRRRHLILKNAANIEIKTLSEDELKKENKNIYKLYEQVFDHAKFKLVKLPENYFLDCKQNFGDKFMVTTFHYNGKMVAFTSPQSDPQPGGSSRSCTTTTRGSGTSRTC